MNAAHLHLLLNHIPALTCLFGFGLLLFGLLARQDAYQRVALGVFVIAGLATIPVYFSGEPAEAVVQTVTTLDEALIEPHEEAALVTLALVETLGVIGLATLWIARRRPAAARMLVRASFVLALAASGSAAWTAHLGGQIRHAEIGAAAAAAGSHGDVDHDR
jgi:hypothetical protein